MEKAPSPLVVDTVTLRWAHEPWCDAGIQPEDADTVKTILGTNHDGEPSYWGAQEAWANQAIGNLHEQRAIYSDRNDAEEQSHRAHGLTPEKGGGLLWDLHMNDGHLMDVPTAHIATMLVLRYGMLWQDAVPEPPKVKDMFVRSWVGDHMGYGWGPSAKTTLRAEDTVYNAASHAARAVLGHDSLHPETRAVWASVLQGSPLDRLDAQRVAVGAFGLLEQARKVIARDEAVVALFHQGQDSAKGVGRIAWVRRRQQDGPDDPFTYDKARILLPMDSGVMERAGGAGYEQLPHNAVPAIELFSPFIVAGDGSRHLPPFAVDTRPGALLGLTETRSGFNALMGLSGLQRRAEKGHISSSGLKLVEFALCAAGVEPHTELSRSIRQPQRRPSSGE